MTDAPTRSRLGLDVVGLGVALTAWAVPFFVMRPYTGRNVGGVFASGLPGTAIVALALGALSIGVVLTVKRPVAWLAPALPGLALAEALRRAGRAGATTPLSGETLGARAGRSLDALGVAASGVGATALVVAGAAILCAAALGIRTHRATAQPLSPVRLGMLAALGAAATASLAIYVSRKSDSVDVRLVWTAALPACVGVGLLAAARTSGDEGERDRGAGELAVLVALASAAAVCVAIAVGARTFVTDRELLPEEPAALAIAHAVRAGRRAALFAAVPWAASIAHARVRIFRVGIAQGALAVVALAAALAPALAVWLAARGARELVARAATLRLATPTDVALGAEPSRGTCERVAEDRVLYIGSATVHLGDKDLGPVTLSPGDPAAPCILEEAIAPTAIGVDASGTFDRARCVLGALAAADKRAQRPPPDQSTGPMYLYRSYEAPEGCGYAWVGASDEGPSCGPSFVPSAFCLAPDAGVPATKWLVVHLRADGPFELAWAWNDEETDPRTVARHAEERGGETVFPALRDAIVETGERHRAHLDAADRRFDRAVIRVAPGVRTKDVLDVRATILSILRPQTFGAEGSPAEVPAFDVGVLPDP